MESQDHNQLIALITGANQGVGNEIAKALAANGYIVYLGSRSLANGKKAAAEIGDNAKAVQLDVTQQESINAAVAKITSEYGRLDLLVNNAGISHAGTSPKNPEELMATGRAVNVSLDEVRAVWETNVFGVIAVTQKALPLLRKSAAARIVNVSSGLGSLTWISDPECWAREHFGIVYAASKTALNAVTLAFALELEKEGIKVNATSPGYTATALNNFQGTDSLEVGSREPVRVALETGGPTGGFTGPEGKLPW
ncbi:SDR family NAD(P)-dependent oxidoreductase [Mucilaginibacter rubeus]|uniref:SDR family NAD(P)-dependent oxidoreductase n=1 Tax=Mucilaginibacter rubeus TaxID=2027860 RepID=A0AAE6MID7_9SPHI|nr:MULTISPECIES: SDR family NAD(P)-dependent oxidoreductase [Mucilaginibacter]QEM04072.1 SDR family NAD(P)-dependent oxidoreductase [Mucilaginibacter rubeus]QEM16675.1 SDR family NAD(P)-dependent oxidoreductase [Mucilaginibacter gossypii]QTE46849.1 SDR family NAD(P)-dependent oxidoreductase [Mucilaginibacter rubeus]QTE53447.1 SDR family NAD(P)-dependent oxidoreductase [Mucilaginibacter rubeus]QTE58533.1 SDR family NAD(P)-dependent oxidoreductase [Mucilaginibacter rubeus]